MCCGSVSRQSCAVVNTLGRSESTQSLPIMYLFLQESDHLCFGRCILGSCLLRRHREREQLTLEAARSTLNFHENRVAEAIKELVFKTSDEFASEANQICNIKCCAEGPLPATALPQQSKPHNGGKQTLDYRGLTNTDVGTRATELAVDVHACVDDACGCLFHKTCIS